MGRSGPDSQLRVGFLTGSPSHLRWLGLVAKHRLMRAEGLVYPDVFSLPYFVADRVRFIRDGERVPAGRFDLILSELNREEPQLEYLAGIVEAGHTPVAVIPGPPDLLRGSLTPGKLDLVRRILGRAEHVWAYSESIRSFVDELHGSPRSRLIPWPFDADATERLGQGGRGSQGETIDVLLNVPLRFTGGAQNHPLLLKRLILDRLSGLPAREAGRFRFHTFVYSDEDRRAYRESRYAEGWSIRLERKRGYARFVRLLGRCHAVVNLTSGGVLGRITFLAAALQRPGIFSANAELNRRLYPGATTANPPDAGQLEGLLDSLLRGLAFGEADGRFLPSRAVTREVGDFAANARRFSALVAGRVLAE